MLSRKIYKFCKNGFRITSKAQNRKLVASCIFLTLTLAGCQNIQPTEPVSTSVPTKETIEDESKAEAEIVAEIYRGVYGKIQENESMNMLEATKEIVKNLGEKGYSAIDDKNQINMTQADQVIQFCNAVDAKAEAEQTIIEIMDPGWFAIYEFKTKEGSVDIEKNIYQYRNGALEKTSAGAYRAEEWNYSEDGFLMFSGSWYSEELYILTLSEAEEHKAFRILPLDEKCRELNRKYILPISYERNNMFLIDWDENDFGELDFYDLYDIFFPQVNGQVMNYVADDDLSNIEVYQIPKDEFEKVIMSYFNIESGTLQSKTVYDPKKAVYEYKPRGFEEVEYPEYPFPEVVEYRENNDGTITLTVNVVFPYAGISKVYTHEVVVRPMTDGTFQYVSNRIIPSDDNHEETWHVDRLTADEWENLYGVNR